MKPFMEFEGKNVDQAIENACRELKFTKRKLQYDIISSGSSGIFGLVGVKKARIRVIVPVNQKDSISHTAVDDSFDSVKELVDEAFEEKESDRAERRSGKEERRNKVGRNFGKKTKPVEATIEPISETTINIGKEALEKILELVTTDTTISVDQHNDKITYNVTGGNSGVVIGKRGQTLEAIQYIVDKIINKQSEQKIRVQVDVEGYLQTRKKNLKQLATKLADKTKKTGKPSTIGQMNAHDRRIIHLALKNDKSVRTQSMGDGYYRKLVIFPKRGGSKRKMADKR